MKRVANVEEWLARATRDLSDDAVERIRTEIIGHFQTTLGSGHTLEAGLASLGDPRGANRQYRRVYLTRKEAAAAGAFANPGKSLKEAIAQDLLYLVLVGWGVSRSGSSLQSLLGTLLFVLIWLRTPLVAFYLPNTRKRCHNHLWIFIGRVLFSVLCVGYASPTAGLILLGLWVPLVMASDEYQRWKVIRKLPHSPEGIPIVPEVPATTLTDFESQALQSLRRLRACDYVGIAAVSLAVAVFVLGSPPVGGTLLGALAFAHLVPRVVSIKTQDRGRRFRRIKWYLFALTAVVPLCYVFFGSLEPDPRRVTTFAWASIGAHLILLAHVLREPVLVRLRNKLPVDQWPERLHH